LIGAAWSSEVTATSVRLHAEINPNGSSTTYHFDYLTEVAYIANLNAGKSGFAGAAKAPAGTDQTLGSGTSFQTVQQSIGALERETTYRYRVVAGTETGAPHSFTTESLGGASVLLDGRGWEMVSPVEKNGGELQGFGGNNGGGVLQAAASGELATFSSRSSFDGTADGAPFASQYISRRGPEGWSTQDITTPLLSGGYGDHPNGVPYQLFSPDLSLGLLLNPRRCEEGEVCPVGYSVRDSADGALTPSPEAPDLHFAGASPDLRQVVFSTCAKLTPDATEVPSGAGGCDAAAPNLYEWSAGGLKLVNVAPGAELAAPSGAVSSDGSRVYFTEGGKLWLREGTAAPFELGEGAEFQTATPTGSIAIYTEGGHLFKYTTATHTSSDLTPGGGVEGVLGASEDGSYVYYLTGAGLFLSHGASSVEVAAGADSSNYPPATGTARVSADGTHLAFLSKLELTGFDNTDQITKEPDDEVFLYSAGGGGTLACVSCNPTGERPLGPSTIPGAIANGAEPGATDAYKPRSLSAEGTRLLFDSGDSLVLQDTDNAPDVYEWEAPGTGSCPGPKPCIGLISSGRAAEGASFVDASTDGTDAFFLTAASLVPQDPGSVDLYDARVGGGFPQPPSPIPCEGDACQSLPPEPEDPRPGTTVPGQANPPLRFKKRHHRKRHRKHHRHRKSHKRAVHKRGRGNR
jgi:hypothetical protein